MKRRAAARMQRIGNISAGDTPANGQSAVEGASLGRSISTDPPSGSEAPEKHWKLDQAEGIAAPVIRANMISLRVSYQGRVQVAFFDHL